MPLTNEQITAFTAKASAAGATPQQIAAEIARKQSEVSEIERVNAAASAGVISPDEAFKAGADVESLVAAKQNQGAESKKPVLSAVERILARDTKPITGRLQIRGSQNPLLGPFVGGSDAQTTANMYEQLKGILSLDSISKLKGTGSISDREFATLSAAASELGRNQSDTDFRATLERIQSELQATQQAPQPKAKKEKTAAAPSIGRFTVVIE